MHTKKPFQRFSGVMITMIPCPGYGTVEQRENPPPKRKFHSKRARKVFALQHKGVVLPSKRGVEDQNIQRMSSLTCEVEMFQESISIWQQRACGGKELEEIVRIRVHKKIAENFFGIRQVCVHDLKGVKCMNAHHKDLENSKTIHIKGWTITLLQQNNNRSKRKSTAP